MYWKSMSIACRSRVIDSPFGVSQSLRSAWRIESAGTWATTGRSVPPLLIQAGLDYGIDLRSHRRAACG